MTRVSNDFGAPAANEAFSGTSDAINDLDLSTFLKLMITELQNQDPLNPLDNKEMLAQISQLREVGATDNLTKTLNSVLLGQNIASSTGLIGAEITALSDDFESVDGIVNRVSIDGGVPKLHVDLSTDVTVSADEGNIDTGTYSYRVVWEEGGKLFGVELSGEQAVTTDGPGSAITVRNLPKTSVSKHVYRTDASGEGAYQLVGITGGSKGSFIDKLADDERSETRLAQPFQPLTNLGRSYEVSLNNVSGIRPAAGGASGS
jgi:flagellar hook assembly protein FlgD